MRRIISLALTSIASFVLSGIALVWFSYRPGGPLNPHKSVAAAHPTAIPQIEQHCVDLNMRGLSMTDPNDGKPITEFDGWTMTKKNERKYELCWTPKPTEDSKIASAKEKQ